MSEKLIVSREKLDSLAEVIASKSEHDVPLTFEGMEDAVLSIETGIEPTGTISITKNGIHDVTEYANAKVNVEPRLQGVTVKSTTDYQYIYPDDGYYGIDEVEVEPIQLETTGVTPTTETQIINSSSNYDGLSQVTVNPIPSEYIIPTGTKSITANGTGIDVTQYANVNVAVPDSMFVITVSYNSQTEMWEPDKTFAEIQSAHTTNKMIAVQSDNSSVISDGFFESTNQEFHYRIIDTSGFPFVDQSYICRSNGISIEEEHEMPYLQSKSVTPTRATQTITPDSGYNALSQVIVNPIPPEYGLITWDGNVLTVS